MIKYIILIGVFLVAAWYDKPNVVEVGLIWPSEATGSVFKVRSE